MREAREKTEESVLLKFKLRNFMKKYNLEQRDIAAYTGLSQTTVSFILSGRRFASNKAQHRIEEVMKMFEKGGEKGE